MSFTQSTFATVGAQAAPSPTVYSYSTTDSVGTVTGAGYFADKSGQFNEGDMILADTLDGFSLLSISSAGDAVSQIGAIGLVLISTEQDWIDSTTDLTGGRRQMGLNLSYRLLAPVTRSFSLVCNGVNAIRSENFIIGVDTYSGASNESYECTTTSDGLLLRNMQSVSLSAPWLGFTASLGLFISNSTCIVKDLGTFEGGIFFSENYQFGIESNGLTAGLDFTNTGFTVSMSNCTTFPDKTATFDILALGTSVWDNIRISDMEFNAGAPNKPMSGAASGNNLSVNGAGFVSHCNFGVATTAVSGISPADDPWIFTGNLGVADSSQNLGGSVANNAVVTVIGVGAGDNGNPIAVNSGGLATSYLSERFSLSTAGVATYTGTNPATVEVLVTGIADTAAGNNVAYTFYIAHDDVVIEGSRAPVHLDSADPGRFATQALVNVVATSTLKVFVENNDDTTNITISDVNIVIA